MKYLYINNCKIIVNNYSNDFIILTTNEKLDLCMVAKSIYESKFNFISDVIATETEILLKLNHRYKSGMENHIKDLDTSKDKSPRKIRLPVYFYENDNWEHIMGYTKMSMQECIDLLIDSQLIVSMYGFMPGFVYLKGLNPRLHLPRKSIPDSRIPKNSFAIGGPYAGIYSMSSPGGWHVLGTLLTPILNIDIIPPIKLNIGDHVKIISINESDKNNIFSESMTLEKYNSDA